MSTWKNVGMTYLKYADLCATHLRNALKEPAKSKASSLSNMHARVLQWEGGKRGKAGTHPGEGSGAHQACTPAGEQYCQARAGPCAPALRPSTVRYRLCTKRAPFLRRRTGVAGRTESEAGQHFAPIVAPPPAPAHTTPRAPMPSRCGRSHRCTLALTAACSIIVACAQRLSRRRLPWGNDFHRGRP